jgi:hypothetical protein
MFHGNFPLKNIKNKWWRTKSGAAYLITRFNAILYFDHKCSSFKVLNSKLTPKTLEWIGDDE